MEGVQDGRNTRWKEHKMKRTQDGRQGRQDDKEDKMEGTQELIIVAGEMHMESKGHKTR